MAFVAPEAEVSPLQVTFCSQFPGRMCLAKLPLYGVWGDGGWPATPPPAALPLAVLTTQVQATPALSLSQPLPSTRASSLAHKHHLLSFLSLS